MGTEGTLSSLRSIRIPVLSVSQTLTMSENYVARRRPTMPHAPLALYLYKSNISAEIQRAASGIPKQAEVRIKVRGVRHRSGRFFTQAISQ